MSDAYGGIWRYTFKDYLLFIPFFQHCREELVFYPKHEDMAVHIVVIVAGSLICLEHHPGRVRMLGELALRDQIWLIFNILSLMILQTALQHKSLRDFPANSLYTRRFKVNPDTYREEVTTKMRGN